MMAPSAGSGAAATQPLYSPAMRRARSWLTAAIFGLAATAAGPAAAGDWGFDWSGRIDADARGLAADDPDARVAAVVALGRYDASLTRAVLLPLLGDDDDDVRRAAARVLAAGGVVEAVPVLVTWLGDADPRMKLAAAEALGALGSPAAVTALVRSLGDADHAVRAKAVAALGAIGQRGDRAVVVPLIARLADDKADVKRAAIEQLQAIGDRRAVVALVALFSDSATEVQKAAVVAVGKLGDPAAVPAVQRLLAAPQPDVRAVAITALGDLAAGDALDELIALLAGTGEHARRAAVALGQIARAGDATVAPVALRALVAATDDPSARPGAIEGLRLTGSAAVPVLIDNLEGRQPGDARTVVELLAEVGDARATRALIDELERGRVAVATTIAALARTGAARALVPVLRLIATGEPGVRRAAMTALGPLLGRDPRAADALVDRLTDDDEELRVLAAEYLGQIRARSAVAALVAMIGPSQPERLRRAAIDALGAIGDGAAAPGLIAIVRDGPAALGAPAADALSMLDGDGLAGQLAGVVADLRGPGRAHAVRAWGAALRGRPDPRARARLEQLADDGGPTEALAAIGALAAMGDRAAVPTLIALVERGTPDRQRAAAWALGELGDGAALRTLLAAADSKDDRVAATAAWALADLGADPARRAEVGTAASSVLRRLARRGGWAASIDATAALGRLALADAGDELAQNLFHRSLLVRANACAALAARAAAGTPPAADAVTTLVTLVTDDPSALVRAAAARALARLPAPTAAVVDALRAAASDRVPAVRDAAAAGTTAPPARDEWRVFQIVDAALDDAPVREEPYVVVGADGYAWATYTDRRGLIVSESFPAGDAITLPATAEPTL